MLTITPWNLACFCTPFVGAYIASFSQKAKWARPGFEPGTSRTLSENHTPRPTSRTVFGWANGLFSKKQMSPPGGLEPPTFRLTAERASRLRHGGLCMSVEKYYYKHPTSSI